MGSGEGNNPPTTSMTCTATVATAVATTHTPHLPTENGKKKGFVIILP